MSDESVYIKATPTPDGGYRIKMANGSSHTFSPGTIPATEIDNGFFEEDEPIADIRRAWDASTDGGVTTEPTWCLAVDLYNQGERTSFLLCHKPEGHPGEHGNEHYRWPRTDTDPTPEETPT